MSVQCKNCLNAKKKGCKTICLRWSNMGEVNAKKQRLCNGYIKQG